MEFKIDQDYTVEIETKENKISLYVTDDLYQESAGAMIPKDLAVKIAIEILKQAYSLTEEHTDAFTDDIYQVMAEYID